jgi:hypothetical protein
MCNSLALGPPVALDAMDASSPPAPTGGIIADGTYHLVGVTTYGQITTSTVASSLQITGPSWQLVVADDSKDEIRSSMMASASGTTLTFDATCSFSSNDAEAPGLVADSATYTVTATELTLFMAYCFGPGTVSLTYTK